MVAERKRGIDDRKQNTLAPLPSRIRIKVKSRIEKSKASQDLHHSEKPGSSQWRFGAMEAHNGAVEGL